MINYPGERREETWSISHLVCSLMYCSPVYINPVKYLDTFADSTDDGEAKSFKLELVYGITYAENVNNKFLITVECNPAG